MVVRHHTKDRPAGPEMLSGPVPLSRNPQLPKGPPRLTFEVDLEQVMVWDLERLRYEFGKVLRKAIKEVPHEMFRDPTAPVQGPVPEDGCPPLGEEPWPTVTCGIS